ncbi:RNA polymerase sigma factor [Symbiobacterium thermophilum]|uniref:RNA polymerase ECF-type sigma factor n=2 Tax=Symbiobacterium thermophilum TaxID=2734 RepID=Q67Q83_SYMTH|nr:sigma-70 family RNA polymerase sigma factor [Symbiobacterium thermophilum]MBY6275374.1 sigma-70 family RNA polymerase sigma factor [Symbiobacterium thermophilum]BAD40160.1 RNA polymerase ECF-type sigma factor [Symbiobacterium thermophilum IAM 14863]
MREGVEMWAQPALSDDEQLGRLMEVMGGSLLSYANRLLGDPFAAEEVCQDAMYKAWCHMESLEPTSQLRAWLYKVTRNAALDVLRSQRHQTTALLTEDLLDPTPGPESELERKAFVEALREALHRLPQHYNSVLSLRLLAGYSYRDIAEELNLPLGTVKSRLRNGLQYLSRELASVGVDQGYLS